jgi:drug/metabolite transporter (DMT)-like permease
VTTPETRQGSERRPVAGAVFVFGAAALWATFGLFARSLYADGHSALEVASVRTWIGLLAVTIPALGRIGDLRIRRRDIPFFIAYGVVGFALFEVLLLGAFARMPVAVAVALLYTAPAFVVIYSRVLWQETIAGRRKAALVLALLGVFLVTGAAGDVLRGDLSRIDAVGVALGIGAAMGYAAYSIFGKIAIERTTSRAALFWSFLFAAIPLAFLAEPIGPIVRSPSSLPAFIGVGILPTSLAYVLYLRGLRTLRPSTASVLACAEPVFAAIFAMILLGETVSPLQVIGIAAVVSGAVLAVERKSIARDRSGTPGRQDIER